MTTHDVVKSYLDNGVYKVSDNGDLYRCKVKVGNKYTPYKWVDCDPRLCDRVGNKGYKIKSVYHAGETTQQALANDYGVSKATVNHIVNGNRYARV